MAQRLIDRKVVQTFIARTAYTLVVIRTLSIILTNTASAESIGTVVHSRTSAQSVSITLSTIAWIVELGVARRKKYTVLITSMKSYREILLAKGIKVINATVLPFYFLPLVFQYRQFCDRSLCTNNFHQLQLLHLHMDIRSTSQSVFSQLVPVNISSSVMRHWQV